MISNEVPLIVVIRKMSTSLTRKPPWGKESLQCWQTHVLCVSLIVFTCMVWYVVTISLIVKLHYIYTDMSTYPFGQNSTTIGLSCKAKTLLENTCHGQQMYSRAKLGLH